MTKPNTSKRLIKLLKSTDDSHQKFSLLWTQCTEELLRLQEENIALRTCAIKYLDYLGVSKPEHALNSDLKDPDMLA